MRAEKVCDVGELQGIGAGVKTSAEIFAREEYRKLDFFDVSIPMWVVPGYKPRSHIGSPTMMPKVGMDIGSH